MSQIESLPVRLHPTVKAALEAESAEREVSINDVAVGILAKHYEVPFEGTGRRSPGARGAQTVMLRMPSRIYNRIHRDAPPKGPNKRSKLEVVEQILREHYELDAVAA